MKLVVFLTLMVLLCSLPACTRFARVHIAAIDEDTHTPVFLLSVYSAKDGLYLGTTPLDLPLEKDATAPNPTMSILVQGDCYSPAWQFVEISNWAKSRHQAGDAIFKNEVLFKIRSIPGCERKK